MLVRLWRPGGPTKTVLARELVSLIAGARRDRIIHVVADSAYVCKTLRDQIWCPVTRRWVRW
ncbi:MAG: hypothetical protein H0V92_08365 [Pseudonocardiales bacterium]|nr:hypothetical protein [Pseudonocardiales bacterium]